MAGEWWFAGKGSPCSGCLRRDRDNFLPARLEWAEIGVFCCAGRVLYRFGLEAGVAGRVLYRFGLEVGVAGRVLYRWAPVRGFTGQQWKISTPVTRRSVRARSARVRWPPEGPR